MYAIQYMVLLNVYMHLLVLPSYQIGLMHGHGLFKTRYTRSCNIPTMVYNI